MIIKDISGWGFLTGLLLVSFNLFAQQKLSKADTVAQKDITDLYRAVFRKDSPMDTSIKKLNNYILLPALNYMPGTGLQLGLDISGSRFFGNPSNTSLSVFDVFLSKSIREMALIQLKHDIYLTENQWNIQGSWELGKNLMLDHGIGTGRDRPKEFPIRYTYVKWSENIYRRLFPHFFAGAGLAFNYYTKIDEQLVNTEKIKTHNHFYSMSNGYPPDNYFASGFLLNFQYNTRDQPYRSYKGLFADVSLRTNKKWMGSEKNSIQLNTELRKYWSLSSKNPAHVIAFWLWGSYLLDGSIPYLELPGTGSDVDQRLGRGYTISRFKGPSFYYNELEYRFPLTKNKLLSGVAFYNMETASNQRSVKLFQHWEPGGGMGLRILFNKRTRSNFCIDYGIGNYSSNGIFIGLNEVF